MSGLESPARAVVFFGEELVVWPEELAVRRELRAFRELAGARLRTKGTWSSTRPNRPVLVARLLTLDEHLVVRLTLPAELYGTAPRGALRVGVSVDELAPDPNEPRPLAGFLVTVPALRS
jgi:hypothetical protein